MSVIRDIDKLASGKSSYDIVVSEAKLSAAMYNINALRPLINEMNDYTDQMEAKAMGSRQFASWRANSSRADVVIYLYTLDGQWSVVVRGPDEGEYALPDELNRWNDPKERSTFVSEEEAQRDYAAIYLHYLVHLGEPSSSINYPPTTTVYPEPDKGDPP